MGGLQLNQRLLRAREVTMKKLGPIATFAIAFAIAIPSAIYAQEGLERRNH